MSARAGGLIPLVVAAAIASGTPALAAEPTPSPATNTIEASACRGPERTLTQLRAIVATPYPSGPESMAIDEFARQVAATPTLLPPGESAEPATAAAVAESVRTLYACLASGNLAPAPITDDYLRRNAPAGSGVVSSEGGGSAVPPTPVPPLVLGSRLSVDRVTVLGDGLVGAVATIELPAAAGGGTRLDYLLLRQEDGRWLLEQAFAGINLG